MILAVLSFAPSALQAFRLSVGRHECPPTSLLYVGLVTLAMIAVALRTVEVAERRGTGLALVYATGLVLLSYTLLRIGLSKLLKQYCEECPPSGRASMAMLAVAGAVVVDAIFFQLLRG